MNAMNTNTREHGKMVKVQIQRTQRMYGLAMQAGNVAEMVRCAEKLERLEKIRTTLRRINATLAPVMAGAL